MKNILILGGDGSIGKAVVEELNKSNYNLIIISKKKYLKIQDNYYYKFDLNQLKNIKKFVKKIQKRHGFIENFVNCAGTINRKNYLTESFSAFNKVLNVNFIAPMLIMKELINDMKFQKKGSLVNLSSQMSKIPHPNAGASYEISKSSLVTLSRHIASNFAKFNIRSNIISPGTIKSSMQSTMSSSILKNLKNKIPLGRLGTPAEVAKLVKFLISEDSSYITGTDIKIAGGSILD
jgi:3-oxoacyl-[acyl-carrier protein] reductase